MANIVAILMLAVFGFQSLNLPPLGQEENSRTCCGRPICLCKHASGNICPLCKNKEHQLHTLKPIPAAKKSCCLPQTGQKPLINKSLKAIPDPKIYLSKLPCGGDDTKTTLSDNLQVFLTPLDRVETQEAPSRRTPSFAASYLSFHTDPIFPPPKITFLLL